MSELKRCPFCDAEMESSNNQYYFHPDNDCILHGFGFADRRSIKAWNTRISMQNIVKRLEKEGQTMSEAKSMVKYGKASPSSHRYYKAVSVKKAIKIVKEEGGMNE